MDNNTTSTPLPSENDNPAVSSAHIATALAGEIGKVFFGQQDMVKLMLVSLIAGGHVLIEGVPGLGKTLAVRAMAKALDLSFSRIQFTSDLMPSDVIGTNIYDFSTSRFVLKKGPVFTNLLLADEINRTPPKTQSALLEAMEEGKVSIDGSDLPLSQPFMVFATQNPVEFEGTYPLPEAQLDRFMMKLVVSYPNIESEAAMMANYRRGFNSRDFGTADVKQVANGETILACRKEAERVIVDDAVIRYMLDIVAATRQSPYLVLGASPRASVALLQSSRVLALLDGRNYVIPEDVQFLAAPVLRHRLIVSPEAEMDGVGADMVISQTLSHINVPRRIG